MEEGLFEKAFREKNESLGIFKNNDRNMNTRSSIVSAKERAEMTKARYTELKYRQKINRLQQPKVRIVRSRKQKPIMTKKQAKMAKKQAEKGIKAVGSGVKKVAKFLKKKRQPKTMQSRSWKDKVFRHGSIYKSKRR